MGCGAPSWRSVVRPWFCGSRSPPRPARGAHPSPTAPRSQPRAGRGLRHAPRYVRLPHAAAATGPAGERLPPAVGTGHRRRALRRASGARVPAVAAPPPAPSPGLRTRRARHSRGGAGMRFPQGCPCSAGPLLRPAAGGCQRLRPQSEAARLKRHLCFYACCSQAAFSSPQTHWSVCLSSHLNYTSSALDGEIIPSLV